jgi:hypothetical protein
LTADAGVLCWGGRPSGQLGDGFTGGFDSEPHAVKPVGEALISIAAGQVHSCAIGTSGAVYCWGSNSDGALGDGTSAASSATPVKVVDLGGAAAVSCGSDGSKRHTCATTAAGEVHCWGSNASGQLAIGAPDAVPHPRPAAVQGLSAKATAIAAGGQFSCALLQGGAVWCWGANERGQLGDGTIEVRTGPVQAIASGAAAICASTWGACALTSEGAVRCWGVNDQGQLGDGTDSPSRSPKATLLLAGATGISCNSGYQAAHVCARMADGSLRCWGRNRHAQLGNGNTSDRWEPTPVLWP